jgi:hypothetical protein
MKRFFMMSFILSMALTIGCFGQDAMRGPMVISGNGQRIPLFAFAQAQQQQQNQLAAQQPMVQQQPVPQQPVAPQQPYIPVAPNMTPEIRGCIKVQGLVDKVPGFRVLYQGKEEISNDEGFFSFPVEEQRIEKYSLIICKVIKQNFDKTNTIKNVSIIPDKNYHYYTFKRHGFNRGGTWEQREKKLNKKNFVVPSHSIVVLVDPKYVDHIEPWTVELPGNTIKLPIIVIKKTVDRSSLMRVAAKSVLYSLDTAVFHEPIKEVWKTAPQNSKIELSFVQ